MKKEFDKTSKKKYLDGVKLTGRRYESVWDLMVGEKMPLKVRKKVAKQREKV
jgi:hypothetical protein